MSEKNQRMWRPLKAYEDILFDYYSGIVHIMINHEHCHNTFTPTTTAEANDALHICREDQSINVVVLTGAGDEALYLGGDQNVKGRGDYVNKDGMSRLNILNVQKQARSIPRPVIAVVNGYAIGDGHVLHVVCGLSVVSGNAILGQTGSRVGSLDAGLGFSYLARVVGQKEVHGIQFLCRQYSTQEALGMGLINKAAPLNQLRDEHVQWAEEMMLPSPLAPRMIKASLNAELDGQAGIQELTGGATPLRYLMDEAQEDKNASLEKHKPNFKQYSKFPQRPTSPHENTLHLPALLPQIVERLTIGVEPYTLRFRRPAKTSRSEYEAKRIYYLRPQSPEQVDHVGYDEYAPVPQLSCDNLSNCQAVLEQLVGWIAQAPDRFDVASLRPYLSVAFGLATAISNFIAIGHDSEEGSERPFCDTPFTRGELGAPVNGLIWMGDKAYMYRQIKAKLAQGFRYLKLRIGGIDFSEELELLRYVQQHLSPEEMELRVDTSGVLIPEVVLERLKRLSGFRLHFIEQPIPASDQWDELAEFTAASLLLTVLDEELIGIHGRKRRARLLNEGEPHYIIPRPSLHSGVGEWIELAGE